LDLKRSAPADERSDVGIKLIEARRADTVCQPFVGSWGVFPPLVDANLLALAIAAYAGHFGLCATLFEK
jgi:hypothetical protein